MSRHTIRVNDDQPIPFSRGLPQRIESAVLATLGEGPADGPPPAAAEISVTLIDTATITGLNARFHDVDAPTDVLAFDLGAPDEGDERSLLGDVYVCAAVAAEFAREHDEDPEDEIVRLAIHATLHLLGYDHPGDADRYDAPMFRLQERLLEGTRIP